MSYQGDCITLNVLEDNIFELHFNNKNESVNKFDQSTLKELEEVLEIIEANKTIKGLMITSGKSVFIAGADITEFTKMFELGENEIKQYLTNANAIFNRLEDITIPTVSAINGAALGGGLELALTSDLRVASSKAVLGFPEVQLGIIPGFGGTVRAPRVIGIDNAVEWVCTGKQFKAPQALSVGMVDAVVDPDNLRSSALKMLQQAIDGKINVSRRKEEKKQPVKLNDTEKMMAFMTCGAMVSAQADKNMPAPLTALKSMEKGVSLDRSGALDSEAFAFIKIAQTQVANSLVGLFLNDTFIMRTAKKYTRQQVGEIKQAAVLGAGIMGGGIAYQSAVKGVPIYMKDIMQAGLDQGMQEASGILSKRVARKRMKPEKMGAVLSAIRPTLSYDGFKDVDIVVEAVVENTKVKQSVLADVETKVGDNAIIASNTSTISITKLAEALKRPENFCGMHFFNPVHKMPLVEIIRGEKSSEAAIATVVNYALKMGKKPIVVNDCAGFYVNRVLFPYFFGFHLLLRDGVDVQRIDKVMEKFGWPMGPAWLSDVVGLDTAKHAGQVMADAFPERMGFDNDGVIGKMYELGRLGQKNDKGFFVYQLDKKGRKQKIFDDSCAEVVNSVKEREIDITDEEIVDRMMIPMANEVLRCIDEGIVASAAEADMGLIYGLGFPVWRGGICRYLDHLTASVFVEKANKLVDLGKAYEPIELIKNMANENKTFY
jgi:3-hydroxyacyl-CoA dehydrogenase / enoyl-CoA hydratase / 3-hydroxybutyryl-CoA epimerase / enoyl-CoA isomerase